MQKKRENGGYTLLFDFPNKSCKKMAPNQMDLRRRGDRECMRCTRARAEEEGANRRGVDVRGGARVLPPSTGRAR